MPAPTADAAITLWPHACPTSGSASYSAQITTCGPLLPARAAKAVGRPYALRSTASPWDSSRAAHRSADRCSSYASSGSAANAWDSATSSGSRAPTSALTRSTSEGLGDTSGMSSRLDRDLGGIEVVGIGLHRPAQRLVEPRGGEHADEPLAIEHGDPPGVVLEH